MFIIRQKIVTFTSHILAWGGVNCKYDKKKTTKHGKSYVINSVLILTRRSLDGLQSI